MNAKSMLGAALAALLTITYAADATADDRDEDKDKNKRKAACEILTVQELEADEKLVITGTALTLGTNVPSVYFAGVALPVDGLTLTSMHIEADLGGFVLDPETKDYLLTIRRSPGDKGCPAHLVTVVRPVCPKACRDGIIAFVTAFEGGPNPLIICSFDANRFAGHLRFLDGPDDALFIAGESCFARVGMTTFVNIAITNKQQALCAPIAKSLLVDRGLMERADCNISP